MWKVPLGVNAKSPKLEFHPVADWHRGPKHTRSTEFALFFTVSPGWRTVSGIE